MTGSVTMAGVCLVAALGVWYANQRLQDLERVVITHASSVTVAGSDPSSGTDVPAPVDTTPGAAENYLLIGSDSRKDACTAPDSPYAGGLGTVTSDLSDTIILVRVDPKTSQAAILSFPRDLWVTVSGTGRKAKINSAYEPDNPSRLVQTIEENFGVFVDHTVQVSLCAFKSLVDAVGGVKVPFAFPTRDETTGLDIPAAGCVSMSGDEALAYVRSRKDYQYMDDTGWHTDPTSDYGRIARQQDFIRRALQKAIDKGARNPGVARDLLDVALANVVVDQDLTINDLLRLATTLPRLRSVAAAGPQLPGRRSWWRAGRRERDHPGPERTHHQSRARVLPGPGPADRRRPAGCHRRRRSRCDHHRTGRHHDDAHDRGGADHNPTSGGHDHRTGGRSHHHRSRRGRHHHRARDRRGAEPAGDRAPRRPVLSLTR